MKIEMLMYLLCPIRAHLPFLKKKIEIQKENLIRNLCKKVNPIFQKIDNNLKENQKLSELRDWLLPMLMNGQITVGGAEKEIERLGLVAEEGIKYGEEINKKE